MNVKKYIEIYSGNRNRELYPYVSDFEISYSYSNITFDPITTGPIYFTWQGGQGISGGTGISVGTIKSTSSDSTLYLNQLQANPVQTLIYGNDINNAQNILSSIDNYYRGYRISVSTSSRIISSYIASTGTFSVISPFPSGIITSGAVYTISDPSINTTIHIPTIDGLNNSSLQYAEAYNNYYIVDETLSYGTNFVYTPILDYNSCTQSALVVPITNWANTDILTLRKNIPVEKYAVGVSGTNEIYFPSSLTYGTGYYNGNYMYNTTLYGTGINYQTINGTGPAVNNLYLINEYSGNPSNIAIVSPIGTTIYPSSNNIINITTLLRDNYSPLIYNGSIVSQNEPVDYEVALLNLTLPNVNLFTGSRIVYYPYVYVQLSTNSYNNFTTYSNNPNSSKALFIASMTDTNQPLNSSFLKVSSGNQIQTIKFKPNDSFHFSVFLPSGALFRPSQSDYFTPYPCNPILQINALFSIKRL